MGNWISAIGGYLPLLRLDRSYAAQEFGWAGLPLPRKGFRAVAGWDEDPLTMAVEAARGLTDCAELDALRFGSTSAYFTDRAQSAIMLDALALPRTVRTSDAANSRRAGTSALLDALLSDSTEIIAVAEKRDVQPGNPSQFAFGDGAASVRTGESGGAQLVGHFSITHDLVDRYASREHPNSYAYEERFVRDVAVAEILLPVVEGACASAGVSPTEIAHVAVAEPVGGCWASVARKLGTSAPNLCDKIMSAIGDLGAAQPIYGLGLALAEAKVGDLVLAVGFGSGADALIFRVDGETPGAAAMSAALGEGALLSHISRFLSLTGAIVIDWGMRSEFAQKAQATVLERVGRDMIGFIGGRDSLGNVQFPKSSIPANPELGAPEHLEDVRLADDIAKIVSITADRLNFTPDPPFDFGLVQFANGARVLMEMIDRPDGGFAVGQEVRMRLRIKSQNKALGFRTYFWKAAPIARPALGDA
jgi:hydroxymethylglutaryl-CoA synthase